MKKIISSAFVMLALSLGLVSCSDDGKDLPNVDYSVQFSGCVIDQETGSIYVVQGDTLKVESINVKNVDTDKAAALTGAEYYWDYNFLGNSPFPPYGFKIYVSDQTPTGGHNLTIRTGVIAVDKEPAVGILDYPVVVVQDSTELPVTPVATTITSRAGLKAN